MSSSIAEVSAKVSQLCKWVSSFGLLLMTGIVVVQVFARYVLNDSPVWAEQAALLLMIWYVFIAAAAGVREGFHIKIVVIAEALPVRLQRWIRLLTQLLVVLFGLVMAVFGAQLATATWQHTIPTLGLSRGLAYVPIALSGILMAGFSAEQIFAELRNKEVKKLWS